MTSVMRYDEWQNSLGVKALSIDAAGTLKAPGLTVQAVSAVDNAYRSVALGANATTNWVSATITRKYADSKILVMFSGQHGASAQIDTSIRLVSSLDGRLGEGANSSVDTAIVSMGTDRANASNMGTGTYAMPTSNFNYLYTPSNGTLAITLTVQIWVEAAMTVYPNGDGWRGGGQQAHSTGAHLILMEITS